MTLLLDKICKYYGNFASQNAFLHLHVLFLTLRFVKASRQEKLRSEGTLHLVHPIPDKRDWKN